MKIFHTWSKFLIVIFKLIIHASAIFMIMLIIYCIKTNPDWKITNNKTYYINYTVKSDVYDLRNFSNEITSIVRKYKSDAKLVNISYCLRDKYTGVIFLHFFQKTIKILINHIGLRFHLVCLTKKFLHLIVMSPVIMMV